MCQTSKTNLARMTGLTARLRRSGFSLLELVIVLAIIAAITAIAWPHVRPLLRRSSYRAAAQRLKADLAQAREQAIHNGEVWQLRAVLGTGRYVIGPAQSEQDVDRSEQDAIRYHELPDDVVFSQNLPDQRSDDAHPFADESSELTRSDERGDVGRSPETSEYRIEDSRGLPTAATEQTRLANFFPDGRVTETVIELVRPETREKISVRLRGLTGGITIGPTESTAEFTAEPLKSLTDDIPPAEEPNP